MARLTHGSTPCPACGRGGERVWTLTLDDDEVQILRASLGSTGGEGPKGDRLYRVLQGGTEGVVPDYRTWRETAVLEDDEIGPGLSILV